MKMNNLTNSMQSVLVKDIVENRYDAFEHVFQHREEQDEVGWSPNR